MLKRTSKTSEEATETLELNKTIEEVFLSLLSRKEIERERLREVASKWTSESEHSSEDDVAFRTVFQQIRNVRKQMRIETDAMVTAKNELNKRIAKTSSRNIEVLSTLHKELSAQLRKQLEIDIPHQEVLLAEWQKLTKELEEIAH